MERKQPERNEALWAQLQQSAEKGAGLPAALAARACYRYNAQAYNRLWEALTKACGKEPTQLTTLGQFWNPAVERAVVTLVGPAYAKEIRAILALRMEGQYSSAMWRHSYHSKAFGYYASAVIDLLCGLISACCYTESVQALLYCNHDGVPGYKYRLALAIQNGQAAVIALVREAILGDNSEVLLSRAIIEAVIISGNDALLEDLLKLLVAARLQEGVRQQILESADVGSTRVLARVIALCLEQDLFRYSSAIRAFDTWTGLGYGDAKPAYIKACAAYAHACLTDEATRKEYLNSENAQKAYFALWAMGCYEIGDTDRMTQALLQDEKQYRRVLGWLFVARSNSDRYKMHFAQQYLQQRDEEILAWVVSCLPVTGALLSGYRRPGEPWGGKATPNALFPADKQQRQQLFDQLKQTALFIGNTCRTFTGNPFDFVSITLENTRVISCMISLAGYDMDIGLTDQLLALQPLLNAYQRRAVILHLLQPEASREHRAYLRRALNDRSVHVKEIAVERLSACKLDAEDYSALAEGLRTKSSPVRKAILSVFSKQTPADLQPVLSAMLASENEYQNQAAVELLLDGKNENPAMAAQYARPLEQLRQKPLSTQTTILLDRLLAAQSDEQQYTAENGFGLYDPAVTRAFAAGIAPLGAAQPKPGLLQKLLGKKEPQSDLLSAAQIRAMLPSWQELDLVLARMNQVFVRHADYEYETLYWDGSRRKVLFGDGGQSLLLPAEYGIQRIHNSDAKIEMVPFYKEFLAALGVYATDPVKMVGLRYITERSGLPLGPAVEIAPWFAPYLELQLAPTYHNAAYKKYGNRYWQMVSFLRKLHQLFDAHAVFAVAMRLYRSLVAIYGEENLGRSYTQSKAGSPLQAYGARAENPVINHWSFTYIRGIIRSLALCPEDYRVWFLQEYRLEKRSGVWAAQGLAMEDYFRACEEGIAPKDALMEFLLSAQAQLPGNIKKLTNPNRWPDSRALFAQYPWAADVARSLAERIAQVEEKRGELPTPLTGHAQSIERLEGAAHFCKLLAALGKETFFRGYAYSSDTTKKAILSRLLKRCYPSQQDTSERLAALVKQTDISETRLAQAVMYAPQWAGFAEKILGWPGLQCGVWFFHAHINETFSAEKETEVALYSPITPQQFNDGAFDKNWFFQAYEQLGEKRFQILYKSAKYITCGSNQHRRSQLYADAVLGRLNAEELEREITEKRNQEKLRCYPLIPMAPGDAQQALHRYEFIQQFQKGSKQFGAQRRESERKACATAMENLAITTGLMDVNRLMWQMESAKMEQIAPYMEPVELEGVSVRLAVDEDGEASLALEKGGKALRAAPKALAKNEDFLALKALAKDLKEQKRRARESLERAMVESTQFDPQELRAISANPVLAPLVSRLVFTDEAERGFLQREGDALCLVTLSGEKKPLGGGPLRVAHPHDLRVAGEWAGYMRLLYEQKRVQPFKQVFREYYPITEDEKQEGLLSRRYAGHQVQPQKTVALLRSRGWTVDYEEGLQKVFYRENCIVRLYALADWFSPADIEAPTLEVVRFFDRGTGEAVELAQVPPILFSEAMRDIDLAVSVAHVGGVDPEASHSTVEMRVAIATELASLLKLHNVSWVGSHAKIQGKLARYSVHMGSGVVHAEGRGMLAILPVHSQARGRLFLPFADDDPKTAEIMSKIILLAEDQKLKDPAILNQICG